jgi:hypothetical protein
MLDVLSKDISLSVLARGEGGVPQATSAIISGWQSTESSCNNLIKESSEYLK